MSRATVLCVDDSEAILALERATLSAHYTVVTATTGQDGLEKVQRLRPDCVLLDLSMPDLDGDQVLAHMLADPALASIPVVVVSSETKRGETCRRSGAADFLPKPVRPAELRAAVERVLAAALEKRRQASLPVLRCSVGGVALALPLEAVRRVAFLPRTRPLPGAPAFQAEVFELEGVPVGVLDLGILLGVDHSVRVIERKVVVLATAVALESRTETATSERGGELLLALTVDEVRDPEEFAAGAFTLHEPDPRVAPAPSSALRAFVQTESGPVPVIEPGAFFSPERLQGLPALLARPASTSTA